MKPHIALAVCFLTPELCSAGDFINLGFDDPDFSHATPFQSGPLLGQSMPTSEAIQGWVLSSENTPTPSRVYIDVSTTPPVSLVSSVKLPSTGVDFGKYGLYLASASQAPGSLQPLYHLSQSGTIPTGATELVFYRTAGDAPPGTPGALQILINNVSVPYTRNRLTSIGTADVAAFAGQQVSLEFVFPKGDGEFDVAGFAVAPEPSTYALFGLGAVALCWQCRRRSNS